MEKLAAHTSDPRVCAIGETGLDYFYDKSPRAAQQANFRTHLAAARATGLPVITSNQAALWGTLRAIDDQRIVPGAGRLFAEA
jgi:TatD DNase family protein